MKNLRNFLWAALKLCYSQKFLIMKTTILLLFFSIIQVMGEGIYSQNSPVSLNLDDVKIEDVLSAIENQSNYYFLYNEKLVDVKQKVDVHVKEEPIKNVLSDLFNGTNVKFVVVNNQILLSPEKLLGSFQTGEIVQPQKKITVTGKVTDRKGNPLPGVSVVIKGTSRGTATNVNGEYSIVLDNPNATLVFSFVGYHSQEVSPSGKTTLDIKLSEDVLGLDEVVVVGYGTQKKVNLTGAVSSVSGKELADRPVTNVSAGLQGVVPNLNITTPVSGGRPGASKHWNIRGFANINGDNYRSPLILVDGVEMNPDDLDPDDIESISVLKDAASAAIYGSRAPYGVVLITTKKGHRNEKMSFSYNNNFGFSSPMILPKSPSSLKWVAAINEAAVNAGSPPKYGGEQLQRIEDYAAGKIKDEVYAVGNDWVGNSNRDWPSLAYSKGNFSQKHSLSFSGGSKLSSYYVSAGYFHQDGDLTWGNDYYNRYNILANFNTTITKWLRFNFSTKFTQSYYNGPLNEAWRPEDHYQIEIISHYPIDGLYLPQDQFPGEFADRTPQRLTYGGRSTRKWNEILYTLGAEIEPIKGWKTNINYNAKYHFSRYTHHYKTVYSRQPDSTFNVLLNPITSFDEGTGSDIYSYLYATSSYDKNIGKHYFKVMLGYEQELMKIYGLGGYKQNLVTDEVPSISTATGEMFIDDNLSHWSTMAFFGRINYNYESKYLLEINARYNGSSRFTGANQWGFFPSASVGYNISKEAFWDPVKRYISNLKLRASWGSLGNQDVQNYLYIPIIPIRTKLDFIIGDERPVYTLAPNLVSKNLTWETINTLDFGADIGFLRNRLGMVFDWYNRKTLGMFGYGTALPSTFGTHPPTENNSDLSTKGWELELKWSDVTNKNFRYSMSFILANSQAKITKYVNNPENVLSDYYPGQVIGDVWGLTTNKIYQSDDEAAAGPDQSQIYGGKWGAGDIGYKDLDGDGKITYGDWTLDNPGDYSIIANTAPHFNYGFTGDLSWKGIDFHIFLQGVAKHDVIFGHGSQLFWGIIGSSWTAVYEPQLDYWRPADETNMLGPNTDAYFPKPYLSDETQKNLQTQTRYIQHAAYMRLKNIQIGYTLPEKLTKKVQTQRIRIYFSAENILTFTKLIKTFDPELVNSFTGGSWFEGMLYPISETYSFGLNLTF